MKEATKGKGGKETEGKVGLRFIPYFVHSSLAAVSRLTRALGEVTARPEKASSVLCWLRSPLDK